MKAVIYRFNQRIPQVKSYSSGVSEGDARGGAGRSPEARGAAAETAARFEKAIALQPLSARARALYGLLLLDGDENAESALRSCSRRRPDTTDWLVQYHVATGLTRIVTTADERDPLVIATARAALERVLAARPDLANAHALGARLDAEEDDGRAAGARGHPARAQGLAGARGLHPARGVHPDAPRRVHRRAATADAADNPEILGSRSATTRRT